MDASGWIALIVGGLIGGWFTQALNSPTPRQEARAILDRMERDKKRSARVHAEMERLRAERRR